MLRVAAGALLWIGVTLALDAGGSLAYLKSLGPRSRASAAEVERAAARVEVSQEPPVFPALWDLLDGDWLLLYSNNAGSVPSAVRVLQRIDGAARSVQHVLQGGAVELTLEHSARVTSDSLPAQVALRLDAVRGGPLSLSLPGLGSTLRTGYFDVTYADEQLRISRGPLGELRVFKRV